MIKGQKHPLYAERLMELGLFNLEVEERAQGDLVHLYQYLTGRVKKMEPGSSQWSSVSGQEAMGTN